MQVYYDPAGWRENLNTVGLSNQPALVLCPAHHLQQPDNQKISTRP